MNQRDLLTSTVTATAGAGLPVTDAGPVWAVPAKSTDAKNTQLFMPFLETSDHAALFCKDWGTGKAVVFVHSWGTNSELWQYQMLYLCGQGLRCIAYDQRGHGRSSQPGDGYEYDTLADDLASLLEHLHLREVTLVGHSMGCGEIVRYLSRHGSGRIARIVFIGTATPFPLKTADNPDGLDKALFANLWASWAKDFPKWLADNARLFFLPETSQEILQWAIRMFHQASLKALIDWHKASADTDFRHELRAITVPTLIIHGDADVLRAHRTARTKNRTTDTG